MKKLLLIVALTCALIVTAMAQTRVHAAYLYDFKNFQQSAIVGYEVNRWNMGDLFKTPTLGKVSGQLWAPVVTAGTGLNIGSAFVFSYDAGQVEPYIGINYQFKDKEKPRGGIVVGLDFKF